MPDLQIYGEAVHGVSPSRTYVSAQGGGKSRRTLYLGNKGTAGYTDPVTNISQVHNAVLEFLGSTATHHDQIRLARVPPKMDPESPWLACTTVEWGGRGDMTNVSAFGYGQVEADPLDNFPLYETYALDLGFESIPYVILLDDEIPTGSLTWTKPDGSTEDVDYAAEWLRYTDVEDLPGGEYIIAQAGQFIFDVASEEYPDGISAGAGQLRMFLPSDSLRITWYRVPFSYISTASRSIKSYIRQGLGHINQFDWGEHDAGQLKFEAVAVVRYTPPVPKVSYWNGSNAIFANEKLCNITLIMSRTDRPFDDSNPDFPSDPRAPLNANVIQAHWNNVPNAHTASFFFAKTKVTGFAFASDRPVYPSFPFELLFSNPGVTA